MTRGCGCDLHNSVWTHSTTYMQQGKATSRCFVISVGSKSELQDRLPTGIDRLSDADKGAPTHMALAWTVTRR